MIKWFHTGTFSNQPRQKIHHPATCRIHDLSICKILAVALYTIFKMKYWVVLPFQNPKNQWDEPIWDWNIQLWVNCLRLLDICNTKGQEQTLLCLKESQAKHLTKHSCRVICDLSQASYVTPQSLSSLMPLILANFQYHPSPLISLHVPGLVQTTLLYNCESNCALFQAVNTSDEA